MQRKKKHFITEPCWHQIFYTQQKTKSFCNIWIYSCRFDVKTIVQVAKKSFFLLQQQYVAIISFALTNLLLILPNQKFCQKNVFLSSSHSLKFTFRIHSSCFAGKQLSNRITTIRIHNNKKLLQQQLYVCVIKYKKPTYIYISRQYSNGM